MKKTVGILLGGISALITTVYSYADTGVGSVCPTQGGFDILCFKDRQGIGPAIGNAINFIFILAALAALLYLIWGGFKWLISGGDKTALEEARNHIIAAIIGLAIIFLSYLVLNLILGFFIPGFNLGTITLPSIGNR